MASPSKNKINFYQPTKFWNIGLCAKSGQIRKASAFCISMTSNTDKLDTSSEKEEMRSKSSTDFASIPASTTSSRRRSAQRNSGNDKTIAKTNTDNGDNNDATETAIENAQIDAEFWMSLMDKFSVHQMPRVLALDELMETYGQSVSTILLSMFNCLNCVFLTWILLSRS
jgi:hypothetical protein